MEGICHDQLFAQLLYEIEVLRLPHFFSKEDEAEMEEHNRQYYRENDVERLFLNHFDIPQQPGEGMVMNGEDIMRKLATWSHKTMEGVSRNQFGRYMTRLNVPRTRGHSSDGYRVVERI